MGGDRMNDVDKLNNISVKSPDYVVAKKLIDLWQSAGKRGIKFSLSMRKVRYLLARKTCYYTGVAFVPNDAKFGRSVDRVDNTKGYTDENTVACLTMFNNAKNNLTIPEIEMLYKGVMRHQKKLNRKNNVHTQLPKVSKEVG